MTDEEKKDQQEEQQEAPEAIEPVVKDEVSEPEAEVPEPEESKPEVPEPEPSETPEPPADTSSEPEADAATPKMERKLKRSQQVKPAGDQRSSEQRAEARREHRAKKAAARKRSRQRLREKKKQTGRAVAQRPAREAAEAIRKYRQGVVVSSKNEKTITVLTETRLPHPQYKKIVRRSKKIWVHDEGNDANQGDTVRVVECRPLSRHKHWRLVEVVERAQ